MKTDCLFSSIFGSGIYLCIAVTKCILFLPHNDQANVTTTKTSFAVYKVINTQILSNCKSCRPFCELAMANDTSHKFFWYNRFAHILAFYVIGNNLKKRYYLVIGGTVI